jgi:hypothetical protein
LRSSLIGSIQRMTRSDTVSTSSIMFKEQPFGSASILQGDKEGTQESVKEMLLVMVPVSWRCSRCWRLSHDWTSCGSCFVLEVDIEVMSQLILILAILVIAV